MSEDEKSVKEKVKSTREVDVTKVKDSWLWIKDTRDMDLLP
jgi:hypothetical protein